MPKKTEGKRKNGRKGFSEEEKARIQNTIIKKIARGHLDKDACALAGVGTTIFYEWMNGTRAKGHECEPDAVFAEAIKRAKLQAKDMHIANIHRVAVSGKQWTASAWYLERKYPKEFGMRAKIEGQIDPSDSLTALFQKAFGTLKVAEQENDHDGNE